MKNWTQLDEAKYQDKTKWLDTYGKALEKTKSHDRAEEIADATLDTIGKVVFPDGSRMTGDKLND
jgi:hypothetical protein